MPPLHFRLLLILSFFLHLITCLSPDLAPLLSFKSASDSSNTILNWNSSTDPCSWPEISCSGDRVTRLVLENLQLQNSFQPLTTLTKLRILSLKNNRFSGSIPDLSNLTSLKLLFLSHNDFSGEFPVSLASTSRLIRLDLSFNNLTGDIPAALLSGLTNLLTLRLEENRFSGQISGLNVQNLQNFNVSGNMLSGQIPFSLSGFPVSAFSNNFRLCGPPLPECSTIESNPSTPGNSSGAFASPIMPSTVPSSPSILPENMFPTKPIKDHRKIKISSLAAVGIAIGDVLILGLVFLLIYWFFRQNHAKKISAKSVAQVEKIVYSPSPWTHPGYERGKMVFLDGSKKFQLEDLLRASAEMLGKGGLGTAYKAILDDGTVVAVKRLKEVCLNLNGKKDFEQQIEVLGRLKHQNLVSLKAYYFAKDEKLLLLDYMENGNLFWLLHGNRGPGRTPLDWTTRLKIAAGAARGLSFIHSSCKSLKLTHGNIKSTNVLIDKTGNARLSDFGLSVFALPSALRSKNGYCAPEAVTDSRKYTQKSDVYSFGVLLLELLTGKCPSIVYDEGAGTEYCGVVDLPRWVQSVVREEWTAEVFDLELMRYKDIEEEMVGLLQIAMACSSASSDQRPKMNQVVKLIEELRGVEMSPTPSHATDDSVSDSPSVYESTCAASL